MPSEQVSTTTPWIAPAMMSGKANIQPPRRLQRDVYLPAPNGAEAGHGVEVDDSAIEVRSIVLGRGHPSGPPRPAQPALGGPLARAA